MAHFYCFPNESGGWNRDRNELVIPLNSSIKMYLVAGSGLSVETDGGIITVNAGLDDDKAVHKKAGLSSWEQSQNIRPVTIQAHGSWGSCKLRAKNSAGGDWVAPVTVYVVRDPYGRRVGTNGDVEDDMRRELGKLGLREAAIRVARDQLSSRVRTNEQGQSLYNLPKGYGGLWCGAFAFWCWEQAAKAKGVNNPFGNSCEALLSPQKAIHWGMREDTPSQLLQYSGFNPMTMKAQQELRENGYQGHFVSPGDIALWRINNAAGFKHVSMVSSVSGSQFTDLNGNAYDAGSGSALAELDHDDMRKKLSDGSYKCFFLHMTI